jgi:5-methylcytosine-specific restriction protein B
MQKLSYLKVLERYHNLCKEDRIAFTTFHQSYGYEEFIEGIKPNIEDGSSDVTYEKKSGIFKLFCEKAGNKKISANNNNLNIKENPTVWKISLEGAGNNKTKRDCFENGRIRIGWTKLDKHVTEDSNLNSTIKYD